MDNLLNDSGHWCLVDFDKALNDILDKPIVLEIEEGYPLEKLSPRAFEMLLYCVFKEQIKVGCFNDVFDNIELMQGVAEQGRDSILTNLNNTVGVIQCKHTINLKTKVDITKTAEEVIKFILNYLQDNSLISDENNFTYYFATNTDFTDTAKELLNDFAGTLSLDRKRTKVWIKNVIKNYKLLHIKYDEILVDNIINITSKITFERINKIDINQLIAQYDKDIAPLFFKLRGYVDNTVVFKILDILEKWVKPKFSDDENNINLDINESIKNYLCWAYEHYSYMKTLVFRNIRVPISELYYPLTLSCTSGGKEYEIERYPLELMNKYKKILISSTAGMGKSTVMKWIFLSAIENKVGIPVFIELKRLKAKHKVLDEIIDKIKPIHERFDKDGILELIEKGNFIFFLDGYDEIINEEKQEVTEDLQLFLAKAYKNNFILTSRPETALGSFNSFQQFRIRNLKEKEAYKLLNLYDKEGKKSYELIDKLKSEAFRNIKEFLENPLLVSLLYMAYDFKPKVPYKKHLFYAQVYDALFEKHDLIKENFERPKKSNLDIDDFEKVLRYVGYSTAKKGQVEFDRDELIEFISKAKKYTGFDFKETYFLTDLITTVPLFVVEGRLYSWVHKSLQDYFAAKFIEIGAGDKKEIILRKIYELDDVNRFYNILDIYFDLDFKTFRHTILYWIINDIIIYFENNPKEFGDISKDLLVKRKERTFGRKLILKIYDKEQSDYIKSLKGLKVSRYLKDDLIKYNPEYLRSMWHVAYNKNYDKMAVLFYECDQNKTILLKLLFEKNTRYVEHDYLFTLDKYKLSVNNFIEINFDENAEVNQIINFESINEMLKVGYSINYNEFIVEKKRIELEFKGKENDDLLDF